MTYRTEILQVPISMKRGRGRPQTLSAAVLKGDALVAVFKSDRAADAYARRLNAWEKANA